MEYEVCPEGTYKVALVIAEGKDYHWYRQNPNGLWSHKRGSTAVTMVDALGDVIYDPEEASRLYYSYDPSSGDYTVYDYSIFVGFFAVSPLNNLYYEVQSQNNQENVSTDYVESTNNDENESEKFAA